MNSFRSFRFLGSVLFLSFVLLPVGAAQEPTRLLHNAFRDHAVLQRGTPIQLWGTATPGATITVTVADKTVEAKAGPGGDWSAQLSSLTAGGPYTIDVRSSSGATQTVADILVGDVFLCSGQSNMALPVRRTLNERAVIQNAANTHIRMMTVPQASSAVPRDTLPGPVSWEVAGSETVPDWSAACYYFAREIQTRVNVPIGLINSSWGGSKISAWMSRGTLADLGGYEEPLSLLRRYAEDERAAQQAFGQEWERWWRRVTDTDPGTEPWQPQTGDTWPKAPAELGNWKEWDVPELQDFNGMLWLRATVDLTAAQAEDGATLSLGGVDEVDQTWINGKVIGNTFGYGIPRFYEIPARFLEEGENVVVVNVLNTYGAGGLVASPAEYTLITGAGRRVPLEAWRYQKIPPDTGFPPRPPWESVGGLSTLHNAMMAPLHRYGLRGLLWYQGESDTDAPDLYLQKLRALKNQWRDPFGADLPVLIVQLANYGPPPTTPTESGWAQVREAQRRATQGDPHAALAVTIDIGSPYDVHPANKQEVGRRLARAARHVVYDEAITPSGPVPARATRQGKRVVVDFEAITGSLVAYSNAAPIGFELCGNERGSCRYADARLDGDRVILQAEAAGQELARVRYCWADSPVCTLYDEAGLPAGPFEIRLSEE